MAYSKPKILGKTVTSEEHFSAGCPEKGGAGVCDNSCQLKH